MDILFLDDYLICLTKTAPLDGLGRSAGRCRERQTSNLREAPDEAQPSTGKSGASLVEELPEFHSFIETHSGKGRLW